MGEADYWTRGYLPYRMIAETFAAGHGMCVSEAGGCAVRPPVYPFLVFLCMKMSASGYPLLVFVEAAIGTGTVLCAFFLARRLFDPFAALLAAAILAVYPHYIWHDTTLQETSLYTLFTALSVLLLLQTRSDPRWSHGLAAGAVLGLAILTRVTVLPFAAAAVIWTAIFANTDFPSRLRISTAVALPILIGVGAWVVRNSRVIGAPVLNSEIGHFLWVGNNPYTFSVYPQGSIDESEEIAREHLSPQEDKQLDELPKQEVERRFARMAFDFVNANPRKALSRAGQKVFAAFSLQFSPRKSTLEQALYAASYGPVLLLGLFGMIKHRDQWQTHLIIYLAFAVFALHSAIFWAHTTHRVYLDVYLAVFASSVASRTCRSNTSTTFSKNVRSLG